MLSKAASIIADVEREVLGDLVLVDDFANAHADLVFAHKPSGFHHRLDLRQVLLGGLQQRFALVRTHFGQL
ncbi:hypothetical protein [Pseudoxanthomonas spadix]|jgi:hypothetical protein|uniref:hypothetical protein n=1 Tax=Pseudoxanthomonas spadix TaxID=415229 RepID=UPI0011C38CDD|nr:hypothetical protein [Pseudoxanthomonas spadix]MBP3975193.1 hypothetical protein [Pseudoxanthomonas spadix]